MVFGENKIISKLGIGPMSSEIIEAVFNVATERQAPLMLIVSKNQIDWDHGYVNTWNTAQFMNYIGELRQKYPQAKVYICRDHCGPGFKNNDLADVYQTIDHDIKNNFDLIHIDFCHLTADRQVVIEESLKAIDYIHQRAPEMLIEVGTDENSGTWLSDVKQIAKDMEIFSVKKNVIFFVCQTGSLIKEINQAGSFNEDFIKQIKPLADKFGLGLKEHNADNLNKNQIARRRNLISAMNVAPQYGVIQTMLTISKAITYGIDIVPWLDLCYQSGRWGKWLDKNDQNNKFLCAVIAGHYNFASPPYEKIYQQISEIEDFRASIIDAVSKNIALYLDNL